jgi:hypothetical protein
MIVWRFFAYWRRGMTLKDSWRAARQMAAQQRQWRAMWRERYWK